jgi:hypothetical protein
VEQANQEMQRTAFQKKAVSKLAPDAVLDLAIELLKADGYVRDERTPPTRSSSSAAGKGSLPPGDG